MDERTKYLGIDYGDKRVGIAVTDDSKSFSFSRDYILNDKNFWENLYKVISEENISRIIVGYPLNLNSEKTIQTLKVEQFKTTLENFLKKKLINAEIFFYDERFTSSIASENLIQSGLKKKKRQEKGLIDSHSARIILQDYIDKEKNINLKL
ncbi:MAG: Holliday junction resolvase RuvX [bacterium]